MELRADLLNGANQAAQFTGLSARTIYHLVEQGSIPYRRMGTRLFFRKSELEITFRSDVASLVGDSSNDNVN